MFFQGFFIGQFNKKGFTRSRHIHQNPELSFHEENTAKFVQNELKKIGVDSKRIGKTGVVALIGDASKGKCIALRADLDALPIEEAKDC